MGVVQGNGRRRRCILGPHQRVLDTPGVVALGRPAAVDGSLGGCQLMNHGADRDGLLDRIAMARVTPCSSA
jgi:hypothetical protein